MLEANWLGHGTRPSLLYPHQWSWDSACIAMGYARWNQARAETELRSLFAGQWSNGLAPAHRLRRRATAATSPGPSSGSPSGRRTPRRAVETSGIVQPPVHATARSAGVPPVRQPRAGGPRSSRELAPKLVAWHEYLYRERTPRRRGWWRSGIHGSRAWTTLRSGTRRSRGSTRARAKIPDYQRVDVELAEPPSDRPTASTTATCTSSASSASSTTAPDRIRDATPFASSRCSSTRCSSRRTSTWRRSRGCSATIPRRSSLGRADGSGSGAKLWNEAEALYVDYDVQGAASPPRGACGRGSRRSTPACRRRAGAEDGRAAGGIARRAGWLFGGR